MAAVILSIEYLSEPQTLESLSFPESPVSAALGTGPNIAAYLQIVNQLELIAGREFVGENEELETLISKNYAIVNDRITEWVGEYLIE